MRDRIHFLLNGERRSPAGAAPLTTVLDWLREVEGLTGTKEGCAEGDCGACTIVTARREEGGVRYEAVNSCLMTLAQLDGCAALTVEGLDRDGALHPVQAALVATHGSQCGFCTPGIVMALHAFHLGGEPADEHLVHEALAGNLCRCTGYRSIVEAARTAAATPRTAPDFAPAAGTPADDARFETNGQIVHAPRTLAAACDIRARRPAARLLAGGTDAGLEFSKDRAPWEETILLSRIAGLDRVAADRDHILIGAAATYARALPVLEADYPAFGALIRRIGSRQIRSLGTIGGNIATASPIGDTLPCLIALDATLVLRRAGGVRELPMEAFFQDYRRTALAGDEIIEAVRIPRPAAGRSFHVYKISRRYDQDISAVVGAYSVAIADGAVASARIAYGGMAAVPKRAPAAEAALRGRPWNAETLGAAKRALEDDFAPIDDVRARASYRRAVAANLLDRLHIESMGDAVPTEVHAL